MDLSRRLKNEVLVPKMRDDADDRVVIERGRVRALVALARIAQARRAEVAHEKHGRFEAWQQKPLECAFVTWMENADRRQVRGHPSCLPPLHPARWPGAESPRFRP